jgi:TetR/AcrR family transcriptional regulator, ethionamide resistance regulator
MPSITRRSQSDRAGRADAMRARMLETIERLLREGDTFTELSVERIVTAVGISRSTFYVYYEDKGHLLRELTDEVLEQMLSASRAWWARLPDARFADVESGIEELIETYRAHSILMAAIVDTSTYDADVRAELHKLIVGGQEELAEQIRRGQKSDKIRPELDPERTAGWLAWMVEHGLHELVRESDEAEAKKLGQALSRILWNALYPEPAPSVRPAD